MAGAAGCARIPQLTVESAALSPLTRRGRLARAVPHGSPGHKRGLVRAKKHGTKSGPGAAPLRRGFFEGGRSDYLLSWT